MGDSLERDALASHGKPPPIDIDQLQIEGDSATNLYWAEFAKQGNHYFIRPHRNMLWWNLTATGVVAFAFIAAGWAVRRWIADSGEFLIWLIVIGTFTVTTMLTLYLWIFLVMRKRGPWLIADLDQNMLHCRIADQSWPLGKIESLILVEDELSFSSRRQRLQEIKVVVSGETYHVYSQVKILSHNLLKVAQKFGDAIDVPVHFVSVSPKPKLFGIEIG